MAFLETRKSTILVRAWRDGRKETVRSFRITQLAEAEQFARMLNERKATLDSQGVGARSLRDFFYAEDRDGYRTQVEIAPNTWVDYESHMRLHILPILGEMRVDSIGKGDVQDMMRELEKNRTPVPTRIRCHRVLSAVMAVLVENNTVPLNPCHRVKVPKYTRAWKPILEQEQVHTLIRCFPNLPAKLMVYVLAETGCRSGEVRELRRKDFTFGTVSYIQFARAVSDVGDSNNPDGTGRFYVGDTTKGGEKAARLCSIPQDLSDLMLTYFNENRLKPNDLVFPAKLVAPHYGRPMTRPVGIALTPEVVDTLGVTEPNDKGKVYRHGTTTAYVNGGCRCPWCRQAMREYQAQRRAKLAEGKGRAVGAPRTNMTGHLPDDVWTTIWKAALMDARLDSTIGVHSLRHSVAVWMLEDGAPMPVVAAQLGHTDIRTTAQYTRLTAMRSRAGRSIAGGIDLREPALRVV